MSPAKNIAELQPSLFRKDASVIRTPEWRLIHARLRHERERLGLTLEEMALGIGCSPSLLDADTRPISANVLCWLAKAGADVNFILSGCAAATTRQEAA